jgi:hypothetical protein
VRARAFIAAVAATAIAVSACAGTGGSPRSAAAPPPAGPPRAAQAEGDACERASAPCPHPRKSGETGRRTVNVDDPRFWLALPLAAALIVTAPLWLPHVMFK